MMPVSRRTFLSLAPLPALVPADFSSESSRAGRRQAANPARPAIPAVFPSQDPDVAREIVAASHGNVARVRELLPGRPALANAAWDWGYGDWESALGAASHVGHREIAGLLLAAGARPTIFSAAMLGQLDAVKASVAASPGVQKTRGPHGITLLSHAKAGGPAATAVVAYLESLGDADPRYATEPLTDADRAAIAGTYTFGQGATERMTVTADARASAIQREGSVPRNLFHLGGRVFHPAGADAVRIRFAAGSPAPSLTVEDGPIVVTAARLILNPA
jgi:hypothetical protein